MPYNSKAPARDSEEGTEARKASLGPDDLLTVREVANRLRVDVTTVRRWISQDLLEAVTLPHRGKRRAYRVKKQTLDRLL